MSKLQPEPPNKFDAEGITQAYREHPNRGWEPCVPCEATTSLCLMGWRIAIGIPWDCGRIQSTLEKKLFVEAVYWEAAKKGIVKNEIRVYALVGTVSERLKLMITDEFRLEVVKEVTCRI